MRKTRPSPSTTFANLRRSMPDKAAQRSPGRLLDSAARLRMQLTHVIVCPRAICETDRCAHQIYFQQGINRTQLYLYDRIKVVFFCELCSYLGNAQYSSREIISFLHSRIPSLCCNIFCRDSTIGTNGNNTCHKNSP